jgi:hypothetical protein
MLDINTYMPITGTFVSCVFGNNDTGINNWGLEEWENEFKLYNKIGIDTIIIIRCEETRNGVHSSGLDPRSTTWSEDENLIAMFFRLCEKYKLKLYVGGTQNLDNLYKGYWQKEVDESKAFYEKMLEMFGHYSCFEGLYCTVEALPWHFNFCDISIGIVEEAHKLAPEMKKIFSPTLYPVNGYLETYSLMDFEKLYGDMLQAMSGKLDYCAWQDKEYIPACRLGEMENTKIENWLSSAKNITERAGIGFWVNVETFQRASTKAHKQQEYRQIDYRCLAAKLQAASKFADKIITYEFSTCMSPNAEWGSSKMLLKRYLEMLGFNKNIADFNF